MDYGPPVVSCPENARGRPGGNYFCKDKYTEQSPTGSYLQDLRKVGQTRFGCLDMEGADWGG